MARKILVADLLCGAGGSTTGCSRALEELGLEMEIVCLNHWQTAIDTHQKNHPKARHYVQDIATVRPHLIVPEGYLDLLMASPTCTHHSVARGGKPTSDQQRSDPWHIITWFTELRVKRAIIENVWEFLGWGPVDARTGKPIKSRKGEYFRAWIDTIWRLGATSIEWRKLNAADFGDATTRQRLIIMIRFDGKPIAWPVPTHHRREPGRLELFPTMLSWRPAREIIDWSIKGKSIFGRKKDLAPKTMARIYAGAVKHKWPEPYLVILRNHMAGQSVDGPLPTIAANGNHIGLAQPFIANVAHGNSEGDATADSRRSHSLDEPLGTVHAGGGAFAMVEPFVLSQGAGGVPRIASEPLPTVPTHGAHALISPYYGSGSGESCTSDAEPLPTATAKARFGIVVPVTQSGGGAIARDVDADPLPTMTTAKGGEFGLVIPVTHAGGEDRVIDPDDPLPTITGANRGEMAFITAQHGERPGQAPRVHGLDAPAPTIAASGHIDLVEPVEHYDILFRMLEPHELAAAMGFTTETEAYEFAGTKTEKIKQIGNAVSVRKMQACVGALMADAVQKRARHADTKAVAA